MNERLYVPCFRVLQPVSSHIRPAEQPTTRPNPPPRTSPLHIASAQVERFIASARAKHFNFKDARHPQVRRSGHGTWDMHVGRRSHRCIL